MWFLLLSDASFAVWLPNAMIIWPLQNNLLLIMIIHPYDMADLFALEEMEN